MKNLCCAVVFVVLSASVGLADYSNFEASHVHPIALTPSGSKLLAVNTPDALLEVFAIAGDGSLQGIAAIPVGLEPVTVVARSDSEAWVVNQLSDSVSIVDLDRSVVVKTLLVGDEPTDVVLVDGKAFVSIAGEDRIAVYDISDLDAAPASVSLFSSRPRALAVSNDESEVYAVPLESGNQTTVVNGNVIFDGTATLVPARLTALGLNDIM
jgi:DNA-binding beta-propeller fold protein YncE